MANNPKAKYQVLDVPFEAVGAHVRNAALSSAVTLTCPAGANTLRISVETQAVRVRFDGTAPTATTGIVWAAGETRDEPVSPGQAIQVIEATASAVINYQWGLR